MILSYCNGEWLVKSHFVEKDRVKGAGFRKWDPERKVWITTQDHVALKLRQYADDTAKRRIDEVEQKHIKNKELSRSKGIDIDIPVPSGLSLYPFQKTGIAFMIDKWAILQADSMGLGKTIQATAVINHFNDIRSVLVVCPATLRVNWERELNKWLTRNFSIEVVTATTKKWSNKANIIVVNYDILKKWSKQIKAKEWDLLIIDEAHAIKNPKAQRTIEIVGKKDKKKGWSKEPIQAKRKILMTGTPISNRPVELWPLIHYLAPDDWPSFWDFAQRYCGAHYNGYGWDFRGATNLAELNDRLRSTIMIRRLKEEVLPDLPTKTRQMIEIPADAAGNVVAMEKAAWSKREHLLDQLKVQVELDKAESEEKYKESVKKLTTEMKVAFDEMAKLRHATAVSKIPFVVKHLEEVIDAQGKVVCFAHHKDVVSGIMQAFGTSAVKLTGDDKPEEKQAAVDRFQTDKNCSLFVGNIKAAGTGITLTAASTVVFAELDYVPGNVSQAESRLLRIGQKNNVLVQHIVLEGSIDCKMATTLIEKQEIIDRALDTDEIVPPVTPGEIPATSKTTRKNVERESQLITSKEIREIHEALKFLASICDGAKSKDEMGFSLVDTQIGKSLAAVTELTPKQAVLGKRIVQKYRRQIPENLCD